RTTGQTVQLEQLPADLENSARFTRLIFRPVLEASFEPGLMRREGLIPAGSAVIGETSGRFGACLDLRQGGGVHVGGRGGQPTLREGFVLEFHFLNELGGESTLLEWPGLCKIWQDRGASLHARVEVASIPSANSEKQPLLRVSSDLESPPDAISPGRWHKIRLSVLDGFMNLFVDGKLEASQEWEGIIGKPDAEPFIGDEKGRFQGLFDEFQVLARSRETGPEIREGVEVLMDSSSLKFDRDGFLDPLSHPDSVLIRVMEIETEVASFRVGRFTQEAAQ
ncbi:MAG: hypothetical protein QF745_09760, partial [Planctomycetota bacterium]|nr:hypothetical protein [Planctomycetota bacterium]